MANSVLPAWVCRANANAAPAVIGHRGKARVIECSGCHAETILKQRKQTITVWTCPKCQATNHTERGNE